MANIQTVGIVGEGKMGTSIFYSLLYQPYKLRWIGSSDADLGKLQQNLEKKIRRSLKSGIIDQEDHDNLLQRTIVSKDLHDVSDCDIVIEAIPEKLSLKQQLFEELDNITKPSCILASNSSSINPSQLSTNTKREDKIIGIHYFYPVALKETVEIITTEKTSAEVIDNVLNFLQTNDKQILELNESNSFILNRLFLNFQNEVYKIVENGKVSVEQVDKLIKEHLFPVGVFDFMDNVGLDTMLTSVQNYISNYPNRDYYSGLENRLRALVEAGNLGLKSGQGFYFYQNGQKILSTSIEPLAPEINHEIVEYLKYTYLATAKRFTMQSGCTIGEMNNAIREYLGLEKGPFE